jgi:hypothetical protein
MLVYHFASNDPSGDVRRDTNSPGISTIYDDAQEAAEGLLGAKNAPNKARCSCGTPNYERKSM